MYNINDINNIENSILVNTNSKSRKQTIFCVLCSNEKIQLECINPEENRYRCPRWKNFYSVGFEILPQEDILESSHEEGENEGAILLNAEDSEFETRENKESKSDIKIPKYFKDSETNKVTYFREE